MKNYFEKNEEENFESIVGGNHQKINSTFYSHRESEFKNPKILESQRIEEIEDFKKSKFEEVKV
jgi:hypothetical protein